MAYSRSHPMENPCCSCELTRAGVEEGAHVRLEHDGRGRGAGTCPFGPGGVTVFNSIALIHPGTELGEPLQQDRRRRHQGKTLARLPCTSTPAAALETLVHLPRIPTASVAKTPPFPRIPTTVRPSVYTPL